MGKLHTIHFILLSIKLSIFGILGVCREDVCLQTPGQNFQFCLCMVVCKFQDELKVRQGEIDG